MESLQYFVLILPIALTALVMAANREAGWRDAFLRGAILFATILTILTEVLGSIHALHRIPILIAWVAVTATALLLRRKPFSLSSRLLSFDWIAVAAIALIEALIAIAAILSPPNSADAMAYHLPRVLFWAQAGSVGFFPTTYFNQISLQPLAEYVVLHTYVLSGGDHFANLVQWCGSVGSVVAVSVLAAAYGANIRTQVLAALFCATLPNGILQASGAKNDYLLAFWLVAMCYFAKRFASDQNRQDLIATALALSLALFTKATAYLFAPPMLAVILLPAALRKREWKWIAAVSIACVLAINGPLYIRNVALSGSPLGPDSAQGDGVFRWRNDRFGWRETASNALRHAAHELGVPNPRWNQRIYDEVLRAHNWIGIDASDPATTWPYTKFEPPHYTNHEADSNNHWHLLLIVLALASLGFAQLRPWRWYASGIVAGFLLYCFYLKWQLFMSRLELPLFVLAAPLVAILIARWRSVALQAIVALFLVNNARPFLLENWTRPLKGPSSLFKTSRDYNYFNDMTQWGDLRQSYRQAADQIASQGCREIGIDTTQFQLEYPLEALLLEREPDSHFVHTGVRNASSRYQVESQRPCAIACLLCAGQPEKLTEYHDYSRVELAGQTIVLLR